MSNSESTTTVNMQAGKSLQDIILKNICKHMRQVKDIPKSLCGETIIEYECLVGTDKPYLVEDNIRHIANCGKPRSTHRIDVLYDNPEEIYSMKLISYHPQDTYKLLKALESQRINYQTTDPREAPTTIIIEDLLEPWSQKPSIYDCLTLAHIDDEDPRIDEVMNIDEIRRLEEIFKKKN